MLRRTGTILLTAGTVGLAAGVLAFMVHGYRIGLGAVNIAVDPSVATVSVSAAFMIIGTVCLRLASARDRNIAARSASESGLRQ